MNEDDPGYFGKYNPPVNCSRNDRIVYDYRWNTRHNPSCFGGDFEGSSYIRSYDADMRRRDQALSDYLSSYYPEHFPIPRDMRRNLTGTKAKMLPLPKPILPSIGSNPIPSLSIDQQNFLRFVDMEEEFYDEYHKQISAEVKESHQARLKRLREADTEVDEEKEEPKRHDYEYHGIKFQL